MNWTWHFLDGYHEQFYAVQLDGFFKEHYVHPTNYIDAQLSYTLIFTPPVEAAPVAGYSKGGKEVAGKEKETPPVPYVMPCWKNLLNNTRSQWVCRTSSINRPRTREASTLVTPSATRAVSMI